MRPWSELWVRIRALFGRGRMERELEEELAFHLDKETEKHIQRGMTPEAARREAHRRFGGVERQRERTREAWGVRELEGLGRDVRLGLRRMWKNPGFAFLATLTLALGVGGTSGMFAVVNALLLRPLPYPDDDRLVWVESEAMITSETMDAWRAGVGAFEESGAFRFGSGVLVGSGAARIATVMPVSDEYLSLLGARTVAGRVWSAAESRPGAPPVALVSHRVWVEELGSGDLSGKSMTVGGVRYDVVGVIEEGFHNLGYDTDLWVPLSLAVGSFNLVARLRPGGTVEAAQREVDALLAGLPAQPGSDLLGRDVHVTSVRERFAGDVRAPVLALFGAAGFVLLLALANLTNLLLSRASRVARELSVRSALGAARSALVRQSLAESAVLALAGGALGLLFARGSVAVMLALAPETLNDALVGAVRIDPAVLVFTVVVTAAATALATLAPALAGTRLASWSTRTRSTPSRSDRRMREALVVSEVALALVLLVGTVLLVRTYWTLRPASPGFEVADRLVAPLRLAGRQQMRDNLGPTPEDPANVELVRGLIASLERSAPGARAAAVRSVPLSGLYATARVVEVDGRPVRSEGGRREVVFQSATPSYLDVMGIAVARGRALEDGDARGAPPAIVVSESAAAQLWPGVADPIGRHITLDPYGADGPRPPDAAQRPPAGPQIIELTVVGITRDVRESGSNTRARAEVYVSYWQVPWPELQLVVHAPAASVTAEDVRSAVAALDPTVPVGPITTVEQIAGEAVAQTRYEMMLMAIFGALALALAVIGCYGVMAYTVAQRTREIAVRIALGASRGSVVREVLARGGRTVGYGLLGGSILSVGGGQLLERSLYGVSPTDPLTYAVAASVLALATLLATWIPALRATSIQPSAALQED